MPYYPPPSANTALSNLASTAVNTTIASDTTLTDDLGTSSIYWNNAYAKALNLNSTANINGASAGILSITGNIALNSTALKLRAGGDTNHYLQYSATNDGPDLYGFGGGRLGAAGTEIVRWTTTGVGIGNTTPTHTLTLPSTSTGIALYNTVDQTTNYERLLIRNNTNVFQIMTDIGGTGTSRNLTFTSASTVMTFAFSNTYKIDLTTSSGTANRGGTSFSHTSTASSGVSAATYIAPAINQTSTAGYTALLINPTETTTGSGAKNLIDAQVGSVSKFLVNNAGSLTLADAATIAVGTTTGTKIGTATSQKLGFFNATPVVQQTGDIITALSNLGLVTSGTVTGGITRSVSSISTPTTAGATASTDYVYLVSGTTTLTLPTAVGNTNRYTVKNVDASLTTTIATTSAQTIDGSASATLPVSNTSVDLISNGSNWAII